MENRQLFIQKLSLPDQSSFVAKTFTTPLFEVGWHQHPEIEIILLAKSHGQVFAGNYAGDYTAGDIFMFGANLPHNFKKYADQSASAIVIQFRENMWGTGFLDMAESKNIRYLFQTALRGLKLGPQSCAFIAPLLCDIEHQQSFMRIITLCRCLHFLAESPDYEVLSSQIIQSLKAVEQERIDKVFNYTFERFRETILIEHVAALVKMSIPAFCSYFKKRAHKTYLSFLIEVRISCAVQLLAETELPVSEVCYESGFCSLSNFHRQFFRIKGVSPKQYRNMLSANGVVHLKKMNS